MEFVCIQIGIKHQSGLKPIYEALDQKFSLTESFVFESNECVTFFLLGRQLPDINDLRAICRQNGISDQEAKPKQVQQFHGVEAAALFLRYLVGIESDYDSMQHLHEQFQIAAKAGHAGPLLHQLFRQGILMHEKVRQESGFFDFAIDTAAIVRELSSKVLGSLENRQIGLIGHHQDFARILNLFSQYGKQEVIRNSHGNTDNDHLASSWQADILLLGDGIDSRHINQLMSARKKSRRSPKVVFDFNPHTSTELFRRIAGVYHYSPTDLDKIRKLNLADRRQVTDRINKWITSELKNFDHLINQGNLHSFAGIIGQSPAMQGIFEQIARIARSDATILIDGESGTGKEVTAIAIHQLSHRAQHAFKTINCGAIPENLLESELFGHVRGAFTGAVASKPGLFETANNGTLFLDEIGELPKHLQVKLLRFLQSGEIKRVGSNDILSVDVRVLAATNQQLKSMVSTGAFRSDLFYRLNVIELTLPPLRERKQDIDLLADHFLNKFASRYRKPVHRISADAGEQLQNYDWPGNVRELENIIERAVVLSIGDEIRPLQLPERITDQSDSASLPVTGSMPLKLLEKHHILATLKACGNNYDLACKKLGIGRTTLWRKLREYQVDVEDES